MNKGVFITLTFLTIVLGVASVLPSQNAFSKILLQSGPPDVMIRTSDGGYLLSGSVAFGSMDIRSWLIKLKPDGDIQWKKIFDSPNTLFDSIRSVAETANGGFVALGSSSEIIKVDSSGKVLWKRVLKDSTGQKASLTSILQAADGTLLAAGAYTSLSSGSDIFVARLDSSGNVLWSRLYGGTGSDIATAVAPGCDGGAFVFGYTSSFGAGQEDLLLMKITSAGDVQWSKVVGRKGSEYAVSAVASQDCGCFVLGQMSVPTSPPAYRPLVMKLDFAGNVAGSKALGGPQFLLIVPRAILTDRGCIVVADALVKDGPADKALVVKLTPALTLSWARLYRTPFRGYASAIAKGSGSGYLVGGQLSTNRINGTILTSLDQAGRNQACNIFRLENIRVYTPGLEIASPNLASQNVAVTAENLAIRITNQALPVSNCPFGQQ